MKLTAANVSVVVPTRGKPEVVEVLLRGLAAYAKGVQVILVEHETSECEEILKEIFPDAVYVAAKDDQAPAERRAHGLSYSDLNNIGAKEATGDILWLLNNDIIVRKNTMPEMLKVLEEKLDVGVVGCKLLKPDNTIQHIGVTFDNYGVPYHLGYGKLHERAYLPAWRSEYYDAVTFASAMVRRSLWQLLEGLSDQYFFNYEDIDFCLRARERGLQCYVAQEAIATHIEGASSDSRTTERHSRDRNLKVFRDTWIESGRLGKITGLHISRGAGPLAMEKLSVALFPSGRGVGVSWWRMDTVAKVLAEKQLVNVQMLYGDVPEDQIMAVLERADLAIWQGWFSEPVHRIAKLGAGRGFRMAYEYDDHPIYLSPFAQCYRGLGTREFKIDAKDGSEVWLWRDGENGFDMARNVQNRTRQLEIMSLVDGILTTTPALADFFRTKINPTVFELPNCLDFRNYPPVYDLYERRPGPVRIGWWGGDNHWHDVSMVGPWLVEFINAEDQARLIQIGAFYKGPFRGIDMNKVEEHEWVHVEGFPYKLGTAALDVVVIPLALPSLPEMKFNHFKSNIKWLEAAAYKIPCLVQAGVEPYASCQDGVNALTYASREEFLEKLDQLCKDPALRARLGQAAYDYAREHHDLDKEIGRWVEAYEAIAKHSARKGELLDAQIAALDDDAVQPRRPQPEPIAVAGDLRPAGSNAAPVEDAAEAS